jgi:hypothetical protein
MSYRRFDWHEHIVEVWGEYKSARAAIDRLRTQVVAAPDLLKNDRIAREYLKRADRNLEGTSFCFPVFPDLHAGLGSNTVEEPPVRIYRLSFVAHDKRLGP